MFELQSKNTANFHFCPKRRNVECREATQNAKSALRAKVFSEPAKARSRHTRRFEFDQAISYDLFLDVHLGKTALGRFAIVSPAVFYGRKEYVSIFDDFAKKLGDAGSIKNDIEDFLCDGDYELFCTDIRLGSPTYPIYYYFSKCNENEKDEFLRLFGKNKDTDYYRLRQNILSKNTAKHCVRKIDSLVDEATANKRKNTALDDVFSAWSGIVKDVRTHFQSNTELIFLPEFNIL